MASKDWLDWMLHRHFCGHLLKHQDFAKRKATGVYRLKKRLVKSLWLFSGFFMLLNPSLALIVSTTLFTAFLSFSILDET